ncbi:ABC transporter permease [Mesomycoplasma lagogenitalium]|uniref:ABC transporter permease n=1 Tax=Mesomycoplasma lagogenitalium TaxID=171286 RepID=A0ABY8LUB8_9BACT|nr:ABC transporter permease [Mesomycoplasma lagogenitalium]WGI36833.1 ABC transporter permease [Mesomycoplasma lagogenitalium]
MFRYFLKRLALAIITFLIILFVVYVIQSSFGKHPFTEAQLAQVSERLSPNSETKIDPLEFYGFTKDPVSRFFIWFKDFFFLGNPGVIYSDTSEYSQNIPKLFFEPLKWTFAVSIPAFLLSVILGITLGVISAYKRGKWQDTSIATFVTIFVALPSFVIAPFIILITSAMGLPFEFKDPRDVNGWLTAISLISPILVFTLSSLAGYTIFVRNQVVTVLTSNQVLIAKAKGLSKWNIFRKHVLRNASVILVGSLLFSYLSLLSGSIVLERFFRIPGSSTIIVSYTERGEINVIMFSLVFFTGLSMLTSIFADMSYAWMDPRIRIANSDNSKNYFNLFKKSRLRNKNYKLLLKNANNQEMEVEENEQL